MEWISSWAGQIIVAVMIATLLEMILPEGKNRKYIKMVIGLYVVFTIISPIVSKASKQDWQKNLKEYENDFAENENIVGEEEINRSYDKTIQMAYEQGMKQDIKTRLAEKGYEVVKLSLKYDTEKKDSYGTIQQIELAVKRDEKVNKEEVEKIEPVDRIEIGEKKTEKEERNEELTQEEKNEILTLLTTVYEIQEEQIILMES